MMKALVLEAVGKLTYRDVPAPVAKPGEVLVAVKACGICSSDFDRCLKTGAYHFPTIPGHEFSGQIVAVGEGEDASLVGKRAVVYPLLPDHACDQCKIEAYARCRNYNYHGSRCDGAFAEYVATPVWNIQTFSDSLDYKVAALCEPAAVAYHAVGAAGPASGRKVGIVGTGTIGILAGIWAKAAGAEVTFACRSERKMALLRSFGFENCVLENLPEGAFDITLECVGSDASLEMAVLSARAGATVVLVGNPDGDKSLARKVYWRILRNELTVKGVWNSCYSCANNEWRKVLSAFERRPESFARLVTDTYPLSAGLGAFDDLKDSSRLSLKGMFVNE